MAGAILLPETASISWVGQTSSIMCRSTTEQQSCGPGQQFQRQAESPPGVSERSHALREQNGLIVTDPGRLQEAPEDLGKFLGSSGVVSGISGEVLEGF